ncbi:homocysteine S-methyltransferase family protein [bacterium]|nr:homocysteine S-methyltransferase family protein [bacterium]
MGTQLEHLGSEMGGQSNLSHPEHVLKIHQHYAECGCDMLITNTLTMNRIFIEIHKMDIDVREVNLIGVQLAKQAANPDQYILGNISSTGVMLEPYGDLPESKARQAFAEQAALLQEGGVDGFIIETMMDLKEALSALRACKEVSSLPVMVSMAFSTPEKGGRTIMGNSARECATALTESGAQAIGANCGDIDPFQMAKIVSIMHIETRQPIIAQPNAGRPKWFNSRTTFDMDPARFSEGIAACIQNGAKLIGGCCGTSPDHISAVVQMFKKHQT